MPTPQIQTLGPFEIVGYVHTPFKRADDLPIQGTAGDVRGSVALLPAYEPALADLDGFDRIWLVYQSLPIGEIATRVIPRLDSAPRGVFATRSLLRPNRLGLTCVRLVRVRGCSLEVEGLDMLDGSPLLDIKPYVPRLDSYPDAWAGWLENRVPHEHAWQQRQRPAPM